MPKVAIFGCAKIQGKSCIACAKCLKAVAKKDGEFARYDDDVQLVALTDCGDCPGVIMPKLGLVKSVVKMLDGDIDVIHLGTCMVKAAKTSGCTMDLEKLPKMIEDAFGIKVVVGTHQYG